MKRSADIDLLVERAEEDASRRRTRPAAVPAPEPERRYVYNGDPQRSTAGYAVRTNRRAIRRRRSTFGIILTMAAAAVAIVLYIGNIVAVNRLAHDVDALRTQWNTLVQNNQVLEAQISRQSALERVSTIATERLGLRVPKDPPQFFDIDEERVADMTDSAE